MHRIRTCFLLFAALFIILLFPSGQVGHAAPSDTKQSEKGISHPDSVSAKLPGGVSHRLKKITKELDKAEKALLKGVGSNQDKAKRSERYIKTAKRYRSEIEKSYKGKFSPDHIEVKAVYDRLAAVEEAALQAAKGEAPSLRSAKAPESKSAARAKIPTKPRETKAALPTTVKKQKEDAKLPGGVASRLKKMGKELDKAEKALDKGAGTAQDLAQRASRHLTGAKRIRKEIDDRYKGQFDQEDPQVKAADQRLTMLESRIGEASTAADKAKAEADRKAEAERQAEEERLAKEKAAEQEAEEKAEAEKAAKEELSNQWIAKLKPFVEAGSPKELKLHPSDDQGRVEKWKSLYDQLKPVWEEYQKAAFPQGKTHDLTSVENDVIRKLDQGLPIYNGWVAKNKQALADMGEFYFSKNPVDPGKSEGFTKTFKAGDNIYCLIKVKKTWAKIYKTSSKARLFIKPSFDGKEIHAQFVNLIGPDELNKDHLVFEIAPAADKVKAYSNPNVVYGKSTPTMQQGPMELTHHLAKMTSGKHRVSFILQDYGKTWAKGEFTIEGSDFGYYADLSEKAADALLKARTLPKAKMQNGKFESEMKDVLKQAGWPDIYRLNIVDKDWWLDRTSGGDSPVKSRHMAAAVLVEGSDGNYFYRICTFHQHKLLSGGFGKFELTHKGPKVPILEENIDK